jgi:uncharacterized protein YuzE
MDISYDTKYDLLNIRFCSESHQVLTTKVDDDIALDFCEDGRLHSIEILDASRRVDLGSVLHEKKAKRGVA